MKFHLSLVLASAAFCGLSNSPAAALRQEDPANAEQLSPGARVSLARQLFKADQIVIRRFQPRSMDAKSLYKLAKDLRGRDFYLEEKGGRLGQPVGNITTMGDSILVMDEQRVVDEILELMTELDAVGGDNDDDGGELRVLEFKPRFVSLETVKSALKSFERSIRNPGGSSQRGSIPNTTYVFERSLLILRDAPQRVEEMLHLLTRLDVPEEQVRLTTWVAIGNSDWNQSTGLPQDLVGDLSALLPGFGFQADGFSIVRTSVAAGRSVEIEIEGKTQDYALQLRPRAFDPKTGQLTVDACNFLKRERPNPQQGGSVSQGMPGRMLFSTSAVLNAGDYTVLGASGSSPIFLIVKVERLGLGIGGAR